ncbi:hypothetical protein ACFL16_00100 [Patescibacteria group bacterium]
MLSLEECYGICPELKKLSEKEVLKIRKQLYDLGKLAIDNFIKKASKE